MYTRKPSSNFSHHQSVRQCLEFSTLATQRSVAACGEASYVEPVQEDYRNRSAKDIHVLVVGSTGYIGKFVVRCENVFSFLG